jgi:hypothetical protein
MHFLDCPAFVVFGQAPICIVPANTRMIFLINSAIFCFSVAAYRAVKVFLLQAQKPRREAA